MPSHPGYAHENYVALAFRFKIVGMIPQSTRLINRVDPLQILGVGQSSS